MSGVLQGSPALLLGVEAFGSIHKFSLAENYRLELIIWITLHFDEPFFGPERITHGDTFNGHKKRLHLTNGGLDGNVA